MQFNDKKIRRTFYNNDLKKFVSRINYLINLNN